MIRHFTPNASARGREEKSLRETAQIHQRAWRRVGRNGWAYSRREGKRRRRAARRRRSASASCAGRLSRERRCRRQTSTVAALRAAASMQRSSSLVSLLVVKAAAAMDGSEERRNRNGGIPIPKSKVSVAGYHGVEDYPYFAFFSFPFLFPFFQLFSSFLLSAPCFNFI